jgi:hypothetical protein
MGASYLEFARPLDHITLTDQKVNSMNRHLTIIEAVVEVMREIGSPMSPSQVLQGIQSKNLYTFRARAPIGIVRAQMRRNSDAAPPRLRRQCNASECLLEIAMRFCLPLFHEKRSAHKK